MLAEMGQCCAPSSGSKPDGKMDEPINIHGITEDMPNEQAALFQHQWQLYPKCVDNNYFYHREVYGRLHGS
jgi:hypothetical protein